jgi:hypothetical protein
VKKPNLRLGEVLEKKGRLAREQTLRALRNQKVLGGTLGTCLLEIDAIAEEELLQALSELHGTPYASPEDLRNLPSEVISHLTPKVAQRCLAIPFHATSTQIKIAVADVNDLAIQDEIRFVVGRRVHWHVATEIRILEALERYYGIECPTRFIKLLDRMNRNRFLWSRDSGTDTLGAETVALPPWELPSIAPPPKSPEETATPAPASEPTAPPAPAPSPVESVAPSAAVPAPPVEPRAAEVAADPAAVASAGESPVSNDDTQDLVAEANRGGILSLAQAEQQLLEPKDRDGVARIVVQFAAGRARRVVLLVVRKLEIAAWLWSGEGLDGPALAAYKVGLDETSIFHGFRDGGELHRGALSPVPAHRDLLASFDPPANAVSLVAVPIRVRGKLVAVLLVERAEGEFSEEGVAELRRLAAKSAIAFELCIMRSKLRSA